MGTSKLQEARHRLKKSQENLAVLKDGDLGGEEGPSEGVLARSKSIGNLRSRAIGEGWEGGKGGGGEDLHNSEHSVGG